MSPTEDPIERAFSPLRAPHEPTPDEIQAVRRWAERPAVTPLRRVRPAVAVISVAAVAVAIAVGSAVDHGQPGTFIGEAGAREVLRAAADATRGDVMPSGWQWSRTITVERRTMEGKRCNDCPTERGVYEQSFTEDVWTGDRGEAYRFGTGGELRAIENEPLLRAAGLMSTPGEGRPDPGMHLPPASANHPTNALTLGLPGWIGDPAAVPSKAAPIARWARAQIAAQDRAWRKQAREGHGRMHSGQTGAERVASTLVDLATSPQLSGPQKAAAFEALASLPVVSVDTVPPVFTDSQRVAVRIAGGRAHKTYPFPRPDRVIVFDRTSFRVVAEQMEDRDGSARATVVFRTRPGTSRRMRMIGGVSGERRYAAPVSVAAPGLDGTNGRLFDVSGALEFGRDGLSIPERPRPPKRTE